MLLSRMPLLILLAGQALSMLGDHGVMDRWHLGFGGVAFGMFDREQGPRGESAFRSTNWLMAMGTRHVAADTLTFTGMVSAEPWSVGKAGYPVLLQEGEAYRNLQITDHQHPHPLLMQLAAAWHRVIGEGTGVTIAGGLVGEPALGPVAYMHRASSWENPVPPLSHHMFDSTHISSGVVTLGVDRQPFAVEASIFRAREPVDTPLGDLHFGALDSWSARVWWRPGPSWTVQASHGFLHEPEQLEPGNQRRTNASVSWLRQGASTFTAVTAAVGQTERTFVTTRALLLESTHRAGRTSFYGRFETMTVETEILLLPEIVHRPHPGELVDPIQALTGGAVRDVGDLRGFRIGIGGDATFNWVPPILQFVYGPHPVSVRASIRVRFPETKGRMWEMTMSQPMSDRMDVMNHGQH